MAAVATSLLTLAVPQAAEAGTNGQQLDVFSHYCWWIDISGVNQDGTASDTGVLYMPNYEMQVGGWWWKGEVAIDCFDYAGAYAGVTFTTVPTSQSSDWWDVIVEPQSASTAAILPLTSELALDQSK